MMLQDRTKLHYFIERIRFGVMSVLTKRNNHYVDLSKKIDSPFEDTAYHLHRDLVQL